MSTLLSAIADQLGKALVKKTTWMVEVEAWGKRVALYREYVDGVHRLELTPEMAKMLRIKENEDERFSLNYADLVVSKLANRLKIERIEAITDGADAAAGNEWVKGLLQDSAFDELQIDVIGDTIGDGDTFIIIDPPRKADAAKKQDAKAMSFVHEPAWDNVTGIIPIYDGRQRVMVAAVKVWEQTDSDHERVNIYYPDRVERFEHKGGLVALGDEPESPWVDAQDKPLGVPFAHFRNRKKTRRAFGLSEVQKMIAPQDVLNRTFMSMTMTSELTSFQRLAFIGIEAKGNVSPGSIWEVVAKDHEGNVAPGIPSDRQVDVKVIEPGEISPFVEQGLFTIEQIGTVSETPLASNMGGDSQSGEALKQRESGLLAKAQTLQVVLGNVFRLLLTQAHRVETTFGAEQPPEIKRYNPVWADAEVRNKAEMVANATLVRDDLDAETYLKEIEPAMAFDVDDIKDIIETKQGESVELLSNLLRSGRSQRAGNGAAVAASGASLLS